jgi:putative tryptophan/tyrosine transport system substrate-binding protein
MNRRTFLCGLTLGPLVPPVTGEAQSGRKPPRVAFITTTSPETSTSADAFRQGMGDLGYVEGQNIVIEWRWGRGRTERFVEFADDVVRIPVDVIVAANTPAGLAAKRATRTIPIVIATMVDPVGDGLVASLGRPGGNITGLTLTTPEMTAKRLQLLKEAIPILSRVAYLADRNAGGYKQTRLAAETAARSLGVQLQVQEVGGPGDLSSAFAKMIQDGADAALVPSGTMLYANRAQVAALAQKRRLPTICAEREHAEAGCLISYGARIQDVFRKAATLVDRILKGTKPADLPVEEPTTFELIINLKTAKALGRTIPQSVLGRADQVIE